MHAACPMGRATTWTRTGRLLFAVDMRHALPLDLESAVSGRDLPDVKLEALCDAMLGDLNLLETNAPLLL